MNKQKQLKTSFFITQVFDFHKDNNIYLYTSRRLRKGLDKLLVDKQFNSLKHPFHKLPSLFTYKPKALTWWIGILFMIGSTGFIAGSIMYLYFGNLLSDFTKNLTFFIGSIFFTSAAYLQYLESINADITNKNYFNKAKKKWVWFAFPHKNLGFLSSASQLVGTILFNINTFNPLYFNLTFLEEDLFIWVPNMIGSILFLTASFFAWLEIYKDKHLKPFRSISWWVIWINILGSVFFQLSAIKSYVCLNSGKLVGSTASLEYTLYGAVCFFIAAYLLIVEMNETKQT